MTPITAGKAFRKPISSEEAPETANNLRGPDAKRIQPGGGTEIDQRQRQDAYIRQSPPCAGMALFCRPRPLLVLHGVSSQARS